MHRPTSERSPLRLVGILDHADPEDTSQWATVRAALAAGLPALMLRDRIRTDEALFELARRLRDETNERGARLLINRRPRLALAVGADGVHVGRDDPPVRELRDQLGGGTIVGYSAHEEVEAARALECGADYVTFSPVFATPSKAGLLEPVGVERLRRLCAYTPGPVLALGGIDISNVEEVMAAGVHGVAAIRGVFSAGSDSGIAVRKMLRKIDRCDGG